MRTRKDYYNHLKTEAERLIMRLFELKQKPEIQRKWGPCPKERFMIYFLHMNGIENGDISRFMGYRDATSVKSRIQTFDNHLYKKRDEYVIFKKAALKLITELNKMEYATRLPNPYMFPFIDCETQIECFQYVCKLTIQE